MGLAESIWNEYKKLTSKTKPNERYKGAKASDAYKKTQKENEEAANEGYEVAELPEDKD